MWRLSRSLAFEKHCFEMLPYVGPCSTILTVGERGQGAAHLSSPLQAVQWLSNDHTLALLVAFSSGLCTIEGKATEDSF